MDRFHNPEFTQMELYVAYKDYEWMMDLVEEMVEKIAIDLHGTTVVQVGENMIDFKTAVETIYHVRSHSAFYRDRYLRNERGGAW